MTQLDQGASPSQSNDAKDLAGFGYKQELHRTLGLFSSFAAAFSYISPSTGIFTLFSLGLLTAGGVFIWSWPIVAIGQFIVALNFAEVSSHFPIAGSVFQWTKYLAGKRYAWFTGWIYVFAGIITVTAVVVTLPLTLLPAFYNMGWSLQASNLHDQIWVAAITLVVITILNIYSVKLVSLINNTGVFFEIVGMVVFAIVMLIVHRHQPISVVTNSGGIHVGFGAFFAAMFMSLFVIYGFDTASTLAEETNEPRRKAPQAVLASVGGAFVIGGIFLLASLMAIPNLATAIKAGLGPRPDHRRQLLQVLGHRLPARRIGRHLRLLHVHHGGDRATLLRHGPRQPSPRLAWALSQGPSPASHTDLGLHRGGDRGCHPLVQVRRRVGYRRHRGHRDDLSVLLPRQPRGDEGEARRVAEGSVSLQARSMGADRQCVGACLRRCHARQLRLAPRGEQPDPEPDTRLTQPRSAISSTRSRSSTQCWRSS